MPKLLHVVRIGKNLHDPCPSRETSGRRNDGWSVDELMQPLACARTPRFL
jgi:hypothetical protein